MRRIIVIGSGFSGSGAVFDYLAGRADICVALKGREFRLIQDPGGVSDLHAAICSRFSVHGASDAIERFRAFAYRYGKSMIPFVNDFRIKKASIDLGAVVHFIDGITALKYPGMTGHEFRKLSAATGFILKARRMWAKKHNRKPEVGVMRLPVSEGEFIEQSGTFIDHVFSDSEKVQSAIATVVNQGGSFWNPVSSTQYYRDRKVILVVRDPRDIFVELKSDGYAYPGGDVDVFCRWYSRIMQRINGEEWENGQVVKVVRFEHFVRDFSRQKAVLDSFLGIPDDVKSKYDANRSMSNVGKYKRILTKHEIEVIGNCLREHIDQ